MGSKLPLRAVLFDLDDTLFSTADFAREARANALRAMIAAGLHLTFEQAAAELDEVIREFTSNYDRHFDTMLLRLPAAACGRVNPAVVVAAGVVAYHETKRERLRAYPDAIEALRELSGRPGLTLGVITAGLTVKQAEKLVRLGVLPYLDPRAVFITEQLGIDKVNPKLYRTACSALGLEPDRCLYIGDHPVRDVDSARAAGMHTVLLRYGGRDNGKVGQTAPDYVIRDYRELLAIVDRDFETEVQPKPAGP
ncbi:MAG TPA: TIGR02253 family HAD-type hydrolase [Planctomycetota bacterium]|nr:TIGR02253 family HAD-type hydrolase [Planctomycetota bacterium]